MFALRGLAIQMRALVGVIVQRTLCCMCDMDKMPRRCPELNHDMMYMITQRQHRNLEGGQS